MKVAIVILNWNGRSMMEQYLPSVLNYSRDEAEVIIADNASTDDSVAWLKETYPHVRVIELAENYGALLDEILRVKPSSAKGKYIKSVSVSSTMSPGVSLDPSITKDYTKED